MFLNTNTNNYISVKKKKNKGKAQPFTTLKQPLASQSLLNTPSERNSASLGYDSWGKKLYLFGGADS